MVDGPHPIPSVYSLYSVHTESIISPKNEHAAIIYTP